MPAVRVGLAGFVGEGIAQFVDNGDGRHRAAREEGGPFAGGVGTEVIDGVEVGF